MIIFRVTVRTGFNPLVRRTFDCDLIDHDRSGDVRLYKYLSKDKGDLFSVELVWKFESHVEFIEGIEWINEESNSYRK